MMAIIPMIDMESKQEVLKQIQMGVTTQYDKYGSKIGTFKTDSYGRTVQYDKYGRQVGSYK